MGSESGSETDYGSVSVNKPEETHFSSYLKDVAPVSALKHDVRFVQVPAPQNNVHVIWSTRQQRTWVKNNPLYLQEKIENLKMKLMNICQMCYLNFWYGF